MKIPALCLLISFLVAGSTLAADFATEVLKATFKFFDPDSTSTCFLVQGEAPDTARYLVTAAHTVERTKGETAVLVLRESKTDGAWERHDLSISIRHNGQPLWVRHAQQDVAVLRLADPLPVSVAALPLAAVADEAALRAAAVHLCSPLFVLTYPERFEANGAGFPVARQGIFASPPLLPMAAHPTFLADFTIFAGDSGGPVFIAKEDGHALIVGIVLAQSHHEDKLKSEYAELLIRHPLGIGTVLHAQYVRETLTLAGKIPAAEPK